MTLMIQMLFAKIFTNFLKPNGVWALELSYFPLLLKNLTYDQICHEHVTYYTLEVFKKLQNKIILRFFMFLSMR